MTTHVLANGREAEVLETRAANLIAGLQAAYRVTFKDTGEVSWLPAFQVKPMEAETTAVAIVETPPAPVRFNYAALDQETQIVVRLAAKEIKGVMQRTAQGILQIGESLADVQSRLANHYQGAFQAWLHDEFGWSQRTAYRFIAVYERIGSRANLAQLNIAASALYLLAEPSTPELAVEEVMQRAEAGEHITYATTQTVVREHKPAPPDRPSASSVRVGYASDIDAALEDQSSPDELPTRTLEEDDAGSGEVRRVDVAAPDPEPAPTSSGRRMDVHYSSESKERYTPAAFMAYVYQLFPVIELDPASNAQANAVVGAERYFDRQQNGLVQAWDAATVYLNPPYGDEIKPFIEKTVAEYTRGAFGEALLLLPARTDTEWFGLLRDFPRCFISGRLHFWNDDDPSLTAGAPFPNAVVYLGSRVEAFGQVFSPIGDVYLLWRPS